MFGWWLMWRVPGLVLIVMLVWWFLVRPVVSEEGWIEVREGFALCGEGQRQEGCVIDGDTLLLSAGGSQRRIRLTGFDAPELDGACKAEVQLARTAREKLRKWLSQGHFEWNGASDPPRDQYGRELRAVRRTLPDGTTQELAEVMITSGLAAANGWGELERDWCAD